MSEPQSPESFEPEVEKVTAPTFRQRYVRLPKRPGRRWLLGTAAVAVVGAAVVGAAVAAHHPGRERPPFARSFAERAPGGPWAPGVPGAPDGRKDRHGDGERKSGGKAVHRGAEGGASGLSGSGAGRLAPAPVPSVPADQALAKAAGAVPGGKVDALSVVGRQGGGSSWAVEVLGADGVRHLVTVDGTDGSITGNTTHDR
ncbi:PepSY domain-containing protein [Kitasatospora sp. NPDC059646]|uniref:PepSY domain-containing protein n=1 Tax=Kitasatospora sp. NPDC059646 TaxID=3346893 RepID=UPI0036C3FC97